jgi:hypothetical protein
VEAVTCHGGYVHGEAINLRFELALADSRLTMRSSLVKNRMCVTPLNSTDSSAFILLIGNLTPMKRTQGVQSVFHSMN